MVVNPQTQAAVVLSSIGSAVGSFVAIGSAAFNGFVASKIGATLGNFIVPGIGAFVGFVLGALIGNLFGSKKPRTPTANAEVYLNYTTDKFQLGASSATNGGNLELVRSMATTARDALNGFLVQLAGDYDYDTATGYRYVYTNRGTQQISGTASTFYGHTAGQLWLRTGSNTAAQQNVASADEAVSKGVMWALHQTEVIGGDIFAKRALARSPATDLTSLLGDLQIASDYRFYANNRELINGYITGAYSTLTQAEKDFYDLKDANGNYVNKGFIDRLHTQGEAALTAQELSVYNSLRPSIDRIVQSLDDQAIANPWIITLQRISELKLDKWSASDFNGGLHGFLMSMDLESHDAHLEDIRVSAAGGLNIRVTGSDMTTDPNSSEAQIARLYDAILDRPADPGGLTNWVRYLDGGMPLVDVAAGFLASLEFTWSGPLTDSQFVVRMYQRALNRTPAQWEIDAKLSEISSGRSRAQIAVDVSEGLEHTAIMAGSVSAGLAQERGRGVFSILPQAIDGGRSITVGDVAAIGYTQLTSGNTSGRDFLDFSAMTAAVSWSDYSETTTYQTVWDPYDQTWVQNEVTVSVTGGDDIVVGGSGNDCLRGYAGWDWLEGGAGNDILEGGDGNDVLLGGEGRDVLYGGAGDDYLVSGAGDDHPWAGDGWNAGMWGGDGNDIIVFNGGIDGGFGENGDDIFLMEQDGYIPGSDPTGSYDGNFMDYVDAGAGSDTVSYERFTRETPQTLDSNFWTWASNASAMPAGGINGVVVALWNHPAAWSNGDAYWADAKAIMGDWIKGVENITGSPFNDYLWGDMGVNVIKGGDGDDFLDGHGGNDVLEGGAGADFIVGGGDVDTMSYEGSTAGVYVNLTTAEAYGGHATGDRWHNIASLRGSRFADELTGDGGSNCLTGLGGDDWLVATAGNDIFDGGEGLDTVDYSTATAGVSLSLGSFANGSTTGGSGWGGLAYGHTYIDVEAVLGSAFGDYLAAGFGSQEFMGGAGNDTLAGGADSDTYHFERGDGFDQIVEDNTGSNVLSFGADIKVGDLGFGWQSNSSGVFEIFLLGSPTGDRVRVQGNVVAVGNNKLKVIDLNGGGQIDVSGLTRLRVGGNGDDTVVGESNQVDLVVGYGGNDVLRGTNNSWESTGNVFIGGAGADYMSGSIGDDQYVFDVGDGYDTIADSGGEDTLVFGSTVSADDVRVEVEGGDLIVFYNPGDGNDHVRIANGGTRTVNVYTGETTLNTIEYINAGGTWIDIRKLDIAWTDVEDYSGGWYPIVLDLAGDGLNLTSVDESNVVSRLENGQLARVGWVGPTDGILAFDRNGDGQINRLSEISFVGDKEGAKTDLEGLQAWDTNGDGKLSALDEGWGKLRIWVDRNQNGRSTEGELRTLDEAGITELNLTGRATGYTADLGRDNFVHNTLDFIWSDGSTGTGYDVVLMRRLIAQSGLTREQVIEAWGARGGDAELGRLLNDPLFSTGAARGTGGGQAVNGGSRPLIDNLDVATSDGGTTDNVDANQTLADILARAELDFTDHDDLYEDEEDRWANLLSGRRGGSVDDYVETDAGVTGSTSPAGFMQGAFGRGFSAPDLTSGVETSSNLKSSEDEDGLQQTGGSNVGSGRQSGSLLRDSVPEDAIYADLDGAASTLDAASDDSLSIAPITLANLTSHARWWGTDQTPGLSPGGSLIRDQYLVDDAPIASGAGGNRAISSDRQKLLQALAGFGRDKGASAAVWTRGDEMDSRAGVMSANRTLPLGKPSAQSIAA